jgi:hypothetical protein
VGVRVVATACTFFSTMQEGALRAMGADEDGLRQVQLNELLASADRPSGEDCNVVSRAHSEFLRNDQGGLNGLLWAWLTDPSRAQRKQR